MTHALWFLSIREATKRWKCAFFRWFYVVANRQKKRTVFLPRTSVIFFLASCSCRMKLDTCELFWFPSVWPKSCQCFQHGNSFPRSNDGFCQRFISFQSCLSCYFGFIQVDVNYRNASSVAVLSRLSSKVCSGESILSLTLDPEWNYCEVLVSYFTLSLSPTELPWIFKVNWTFHFSAGDRNQEMREVLCSAACKFSVYVPILSITFDPEGRFIALLNFLFFHSRHFLGFLGQAP